MRYNPRSKLKRIAKSLAEEKLHYFSDGARNYSRKWHFVKTDSSGTNTGSTSLSDYSEYSDFCELASQDNQVFSKFRSCIEYQEILEHVTRSLGKSYLNEIRKYGANNSKILELASDDIGKPFKYYYQGIGKLSPTHLRYYKVLLDLESHFGVLDGFNIVEVGIGYGGQASQICREYSVSNYTLIDLPPVLKLAKKYLDIRSPESPLNYGKDSHKKDVDVDLFISNYAFSELRRDIQDEYFDQFILNSRRGYVTYNHITPQEWGSYSAVEFAEKIVGSEIIAEEPNSFDGNVIVLWGHK